MRSAGIVALLATSVSLVAAQDDQSTTTLTSTTTQTITITQCNPDFPDCPLNTPTTTVEPSTTPVETTSSIETTTSIETSTSELPPPPPPPTTTSVETTWSTYAPIVNSTTALSWSVSNTTSFAGPTAGPTTIITHTPEPQTSTAVVTSTTTSTSSVPGAANGLVAQTGFVAAALIGALALVL
jgi:hypothetical protein